MRQIIPTTIDILNENQISVFFQTSHSHLRFNCAVFFDITYQIILNKHAIDAHFSTSDKLQYSNIHEIFFFSLTYQNIKHENNNKFKLI